MKENSVNKFEFGLILKELNEYGVKRINIRYSGGGDSGQIDGVEAVFHEKKKIKKKIKGKYKWIILPDPIITEWDSMDKTISTWAYDRLESEEDWCNNDGGSGDISIEVPSGKYKLHHGVNITTVEYSTCTGSLKKELADF